MRTAAFLLLRLLERTLDELAEARHRAAMRRFQRDHPEWTFYPDGERAP